MINDIKNKFPIFRNQPGLVYLDNGATTQKPESVLNSLLDFYSNNNANVHRGLYPLSENATALYENARETIAKLINASPEEIIFTAGTTDSLNAVAQMLKNSDLISKNPRILLSELEHHSNILPWQELNGEIDYISLDDNFQLVSPSSNSSYDILAVTSVSNVTGTIVDFNALKSKVNYKFSIIDAAQQAAHFKIDVKELNVDFLAFSGHKMFGPTGIGVLYGKKELLEKLEPFRVGGGMIREVNKNSATWGPLPEKFEAGTPPIAEAVALAEAVRFIEEVGFENIQNHEEELRQYCLERLAEFDGIKIFHPSAKTKACAVISFTLDGVHPHDLAQYLGEQSICSRAGHHCTQILHREYLKVPASLRTSFSIYNTKADIDKMVTALNEAVNIFKK